MKSHKFEIHRNAEGDKLAYISVVGDNCGWRIAGPKAWGGSKCLAGIEFTDKDLVDYICKYAKHLIPMIASLGDKDSEGEK